MTILRRRRSATAKLLEDLDALAEEGNGHARDMAAEIRAKGQKAVQHFLLEVAGHVARAQIFATVDPVGRAFVAYEKATTGIDLGAAPSEHVRARAAASNRDAIVSRAMARRDAAMARAQEREH